MSDAAEEHDPRAVARVGSVLDEKWTLERILGSGGMGAVYAGRHRNGARGAVKILHPELGRRADIRERFLREGYAANRVEHRGAVQVLDDDIVKDGPDEGTAYLVMELLEGECLEDRSLREPRLTENELLRILDDTLAVLVAAHEHGVVHRDLKPANLFLNGDPAGHGVKVLDFGLARLAEAQLVTSAGLALGTPSFMAPEQALGRQDEIDARTDLFAVGATWFMLLTDRGVHEAEGVIEMVARMGTLPAPKVAEVGVPVSEDIARIIDRSLEFRREDRYPSAAAMRADVVAAREARDEAMGRPTREVDVGSRVAAGLIAGAVPSAPDPAEIAAPAAGSPDARVSLTGPPGARRSRATRPLVALGVLVLVGVTLLLVVPRARSAGASSLAALVSTAASPSDTAGSAAGAAGVVTEPGPGVAGPAADSGAEPVLEQGGDGDAGVSADAAVDAGDDEEEDEDDDADASVAGLSSSTPSVAAARVPVAATAGHPVAKRPRTTPHPKPRRKKKRRH